MQRERKIYLDALRIIAIFLVIFNHTPGYTAYMTTKGPKIWIYMVITMITRINVPLFLMVSGALLLSKEETILELIKKRIIRFIAVIIIFNSALYLMGNYSDIHFVNLGLGIIEGTIEGSYWFLYAYTGMLIMLPYIRKAVKGFDQKDFIYIIILHLLFVSILPMVNYILNITKGGSIYINGNFQIPLMTEKILFYPTLGYYFDKIIDIKKIGKKHLVLGSIFAICGIICSCCFTYDEGMRYGFTQNYVQLFDFVTTMVVFLLVRFLFERKNIFSKFPQIEKSICSLGVLTFGVYLLDPFLKRGIYNKVDIVLGEFFPIIISSFVWCVISIMLGSLITFLLRKSSVMKKIL